MPPMITINRFSIGGFLLNLTPPEAVTRHWVYGALHERLIVEGAHEEAVEAAIRYIEQHGLFSRPGPAGAGTSERSQVTGKLATTRISHREGCRCRQGPHDHVVISDRVLSEDGSSCNTVDRAAIYALAPWLSRRYDAAIHEVVSLA